MKSRQQRREEAAARAAATAQLSPEERLLRLNRIDQRGAARRERLRLATLKAAK